MQDSSNQAGNKKLLSAEDKEKLKENAKTYWTKFVTFVTEFTDMIFVSVLVGASIWNVLRLFVFGDDNSEDIIRSHTTLNVIVIIYMLAMAGLIFLLLKKDHPYYALVVE